ncbi:hypothetical protein SVIO_097970 [Streptomyces violaceusniger]|uniref:DUF305 domain-containing protein n=2 Tax=Streptomyces violaceusniger TaxID=68280 RepID=A0A4D4LFM6_STRVO|nr:hypothetical protein SVIO_097970 [Streptomyces violaceusniger]
MTGLVDDRASNARIKSLAGRIEKAQDPEIATLESWLKDWGKPENPARPALSRRTPRPGPCAVPPYARGGPWGALAVLHPGGAAQQGRR